MSLMYNHKLIESKWQTKWKEEKTYQPDLKATNKFYNLMMFPYPSAEGLHVGNMYAFSGADVYGRFKRMQNLNTLEPIGLDGFGIHSENYAIKVGRHPKEHAEISEKNFYNQLSSIGNGFAWENRLETYDKEYYRWTQWLFIQVFKAGLAYKNKASVNWCPKDKTVLADEQVESGLCERCGTEVVRKEMSGWFFKITDYADKLLNGLNEIDWPQKIKIAQKQWIGKKEGSLVTFDVRVPENTNFELKDVQVFTTRLETIFGVSFIVIAPELAQKWVELGWNPSDEVSTYIKESLNKSEQTRKQNAGDKTGVATDLKVVNFVNDKEIPIYIADYVLMEVGTGAVMGVPAHDDRDLEFAKLFDLEVLEVVDETGSQIKSGMTSILVNSGKYNGLTSSEAREKISEDFKDKVTNHTNYHLRDWGISRQRYWGPPIPMINCTECGWVSVPEKDLPVVLPEIEDFVPKGDGTSPLSNAPEEWKNVPCPECGKMAQRELDVSDTFLDSSWYFLAYPNLDTEEYKNGPTPFNAQILKTWFPVDTYIGGAEHAVLHLLYSRFIWMFLVDQKILPQELGNEPFPFLYSHGLIIKDGAKMSKSKGNVVNPDEYIEKYGADTLRTYLMFLGPYDSGGDFRDSGIEGMSRFLDRVWKLYIDVNNVSLSEEDKVVLLSSLNKVIKKVSKDIEVFKYNTAISSIMELVNLMRDLKEKSDVSVASSGIWNEALSKLAQIIAPFAPHIAEEAWAEILGNKFSVHNSRWPEVDESKIVETTVTVIVQVNGKMRASLSLDKDSSVDQDTVRNKALEDNNVTKWIEGKQTKVVFVPGRIINFIF